MSDLQPGQRRRRLIFEHTFEEARARIEPDYKRFDELTQAAQWIIEENAESCPVVATEGETEVRVARSQAAQQEDIIRLFFVIASDSECRVVDVDTTTDPAAEIDP